MARETRNDACEDPNADFLDTFFDDGVLEAMQDVLGNPQSNPNSDDSSCEALDTNATKTSAGVNEAKDKCFSVSLETELSKECSEEASGGKQRIIILKPAHIKDPLHQPESASQKKPGSDSPQESTCSLTAVHDSNKCTLPSGHSFCEETSQSQNSNDQTEESTNYSSMDQLLARVKKILKAMPESEIKVIANENQGNSLAQKEEQKDLVAMVKKCLADPPAFGLVTDKVSSANSSENRRDKVNMKDDKQVKTPCDSKDSKSTVVSTETNTDVTCSKTVRIEEEHRTMDNGAPSLSSSVPLLLHNNQESSATKVSTESKSVAQRDEKEKDLSLEDTFLKGVKQKTPEKQNKININLKTQLLAPTSILNAGSSSQSEQSSCGPDKKKLEQSPSGSNKKKSEQSSSGPGQKKSEQNSSGSDKKKAKQSSPGPDKNKSDGKFSMKQFSNLARTERCLSLSSISNDSLTDTSTSREKKDTIRRKRENSVSGASDSSDCVRSKRRSADKRKEKKKKRNAGSPEKRRKRDKKKSRDTRRRSQSRSRSPSSYKTRRRREKSPKPHRKRRRTYSRSPTPLTNRRVPKRLSRSPRHRSRSRSHSPVRNRKAQSPSDHRKKKSRSKSPFINEICRLKRQWEMEDEAKKGSSRRGQAQSERFLHHMPSWTQETNSTTIVSNMSAISVQVESVQVHSASFSFDNSVDVPPTGFPVGLSPGSGPVSYGVPFRPPEYGISHSGSPYPISFPSPTVFVPLSGINSPASYDQGAAGCEIQPHPQICVPPQLALLPPPLPVVSPPAESTSTISMEPQTSLLRKQLDILLTTVAPTLPEPGTSGKPRNNTAHAANNSLVQIVLQPKEISGSISMTGSSDPEKAGSNVVPPSNPTLQQRASEECAATVKSEQESILGSEKLPENKESSLKPRSVLDEPDRLSSNSDSLSAEKGQLANMCEVEEYDSDVIVEDPPPKAPVELVCLSADEADNTCSLYDLDKELNKIHKDLEELNQSETGEVEATMEPNTETLPKKKRKRKRNKSKSSKESSKDKAHNDEIEGNGSPDREVSIVEDCTETSEDSSDIVLRECREMIDSLRIGRFVFIDEDEDAVANAGSVDQADSNSVFFKSSQVQFSYTRKPKLDLEPKTKNISTNTPIHLLIDVCCGTENVVQKDVGVQSNFDCRGCIEKKDVIKEMNAQLQSMIKERDNLLSIVLDIGNSSQKIPGLDILSGELQTGTKKGNNCTENRVLSSRFINARAVLNSIQSGSNSWRPPSVRTAAVTSQEMLANGSCEPFLSERTRSVMSQIQGISTEPVFYDYNHSSPVPTDVQSHNGSNEYFSPKRPFQ